MACISPDGSLTASARTLLGAMEVSAPLDDVARNTGLPLFRIRASVRELLEAGLVEEREDGYCATETGRAKL